MNSFLFTIFSTIWLMPDNSRNDSFDIEKVVWLLFSVNKSNLKTIKLKKHDLNYLKYYSYLQRAWRCPTAWPEGWLWSGSRGRQSGTRPALGCRTSGAPAPSISLYIQLLWYKINNIQGYLNSTAVFMNHYVWPSVWSWFWAHSQKYSLIL